MRRGAWGPAATPMNSTPSAASQGAHRSWPLRSSRRGHSLLGALTVDSKAPLVLAELARCSRLTRLAPFKRQYANTLHTKVEPAPCMATRESGEAAAERLGSPVYAGRTERSLREYSFDRCVGQQDLIER